MPSINGKWGLRETIGNRMVKGFEESRTTAPPKFRLKYDDLITLVIPYLPRGFGGTVHSALGAAVCKCVILYGYKALVFASSIKHCKFNKGHEDPANALYLYIRDRHSTKEMYLATVVACTAYCKDKKIKGSLVSPPEKDVFEWNKRTWEPKDDTSKSVGGKTPKRSDS